MRGCTWFVLLLAIMAPAQRKPLGHWKLEPGQFRENTLLDTTGTHHATVSGDVKFEGKGAAIAAVFEPSHRYIIAPAATGENLPRQDITLEAWVRADSAGDWRGIISAIQDNGAFERGWLLGFHQGRFIFGLSTEGAGKLTYLTGTTRVRLGRWYHVAATYDGRTQKVWVDGREDAVSQVQSGDILYAPKQPFVLGAYMDDDERHPWEGLLKEIYVWDRTCTPSELARRHRDGRRILGEAISGGHGPDVLEASADWSSYLHDRHRSAYTPGHLPRRPRKNWTHESPHAPSPAWPPPAKGSFWQNLDGIRARVTYDRAYHPIASGDAVFYASSSDDRVRCLDSATGEVRWSFCAEGPIRFAPCVNNARVYFGSDDGHVYCLDAREGGLIWKKLIGPRDRRIPGNGRMISTWPIRTGILVHQGKVYCTAGLFPAQGAWAAALDCSNGSEIWKTPITGHSPQGYLLASRRRLYVPTGRATPVSIDLETGRFLGQFGGAPGTYAVLTSEALVSGAGNKGELDLAGAASREKLASFKGHRMVVTEKMSYLLSDGELSALDRRNFMQLSENLVAAREKQAQCDSSLRAAQKAEKSSQSIGQLKAALVTASSEIDRIEDKRKKCLKWTVQTKGTESLILAGDTLVTGGDGIVATHASRTGRRLWSAPVDGVALGLAVAYGRLFVSTDTGALHAFGAGKTSSARTPNSGAPPVAPWAREAADYIIRSSGCDRGWAVVFDLQDGELAVALAQASTLSIVGVAGTEQQASSLRRRMDEAGLSSRRVSIIVAGNTLPFTDWFANLVVSETCVHEERTFEPSNEQGRLLRPSGGVLVRDARPDSQGLDRRPSLPGAGNWTHAYANPANTACSDDALVSSEVDLQWFGGPGPRPMIDRHLRTAPPLVRDGRIFVPAYDRMIAVDAYNGTILWDVESPGSTRTGFPYDAGYMAVGPKYLYWSAGAACHTLDVHSGERGKDIPVPQTLGGRKSEWGWVALENGRLYGSAQRPTAARRGQSRPDVTEQYGVHRPMVVSRGITAVNTKTRRNDWVLPGIHVLNTSLTLGDGRLYAIESREGGVAADEDGRVPLRDFLGSSSTLVARNAATGRVVWRRPFNPVDIRHSVFVSYAQGVVLVVGCGDRGGRNHYWVHTFQAHDGTPMWTANHANNVTGIHGDHGEQVHHPVILDGRVITEPVAYELATGKKIDPSGADGAWQISGRRGCGTFSGSKNCLFYRSKNPIVMDLQKKGQSTSLTRVSRPGCWINIIPAEGLVILPESSSGCVCAFSLQTSMAFLPRAAPR